MPRGPGNIAYACALTAFAVTGCGANPDDRHATGKPSIERPAAAVPATSAVGPASAEPVNPAVRAAAKIPCAAFVEETRDAEFGAGLNDLVKQARTFRISREALAGRLEDLVARPLDRSMIVRYTSRLRANNAYLLETERQARRGNVKAAYQALTAWTEAIEVESRLVQQLKLKACR